MQNWTTFLLNAALATAPCADPPVPPGKTPLEIWLPVGTSFLQFLVLAVLTYYIFARNARQKVAEREASWYHKIVVDYCIGLMSEFFVQTSEVLCKCAIDLPNLRGAGNQQQFDELIRRTLANFKRELHTMTSDASRRLSFFEASLSERFLDRVDRLEDEVAGWFDNYINGQPFDQRSSLPRALSACQNELLEIIKSYEFSKWGWPSRSVSPKQKSK